MSEKEKNATKEANVMSGEKQEPSRKGISGVVFVGCLMIGFAIGLLTGNMAAGLFGGLGVGFIAMGIVRYITGEW
jgi:predicted lipid-binding transport protein (Tim44 family)